MSEKPNQYEFKLSNQDDGQIKKKKAKLSPFQRQVYTYKEIKDQSAIKQIYNDPLFMKKYPLPKKLDELGKILSRNNSMQSQTL